MYVKAVPFMVLYHLWCSGLPTPILADATQKMIIVYYAWVNLNLQADFVGVASYFMTNVVTKIGSEDETNKIINCRWARWLFKELLVSQ